jgi:hypothetical protein
MGGFLVRDNLTALRELQLDLFEDLLMDSASDFFLLMFPGGYKFQTSTDVGLTLFLNNPLLCGNGFVLCNEASFVVRAGNRNEWSRQRFREFDRMAATRARNDRLLDQQGGFLARDLYLPTIVICCGTAIFGRLHRCNVGGGGSRVVARYANAARSVSASVHPEIYKAAARSWNFGRQTLWNLYHEAPQ